MREALLAVIVGLPVAGVLNGIWFSLDLRNFLAQTPALESDGDLERYKRMVASQMYAALAQIAFLAAPVLIYVGGLVADVLVAPDLVFVVVPSLVVLGVGVWARAAELRARTIHCATPALAAERDRVVDTWLHKPLPDWT